MSRAGEWAVPAPERGRVGTGTADSLKFPCAPANVVFGDALEGDILGVDPRIAQQPLEHEQVRGGRQDRRAVPVDRDPIPPMQLQEVKQAVAVCDEGSYPCFPIRWWRGELREISR